MLDATRDDATGSTRESTSSCSAARREGCEPLLLPAAHDGHDQPPRHDGRRPRDGHARVLQLPGPHRAPAHRRRPPTRRSTSTAPARAACGCSPARPTFTSGSRSASPFAKREDACVYSSGYVTNVAIITGLTGPGDLVLMDKLDHASIVDGCLLSGAKWRTYRHNDMAHLEKLLADAAGEYATILVVADSVFSMDGDVMDLPATKAAVRPLRRAAHGRRGALDRLAGRDRARHRGALRHVRLHRPEDGHAVQVDPERRRLLRRRARDRRLPAPLLPAVHLLGGSASGADGCGPRGVRRHRGRAVARDRAARACSERYTAGLKAQGWDTMVVDHVRRARAGRRRSRRRWTSPACSSTAASSSARSCTRRCRRGTDRLRTCLMATHTDEDIAGASTRSPRRARRSA